MCWTVPRCAIAEHHNVVGQQARDEQQQQRDGRREGRTHHAVELTCSHRRHERPTRAPRPTGVAIARNFIIFNLMILSYLDKRLLDFKTLHDSRR